jgi:hypothetical protein
MNVQETPEQSAAAKSLDKSFSTEIHFLIFERVDSTAISACLGLTCKASWAIHKAKQIKVSLRTSVSYQFTGGELLRNLGLPLTNWVPTNLAYDYQAGKFVQHTTLARCFVKWEEDENLHMWQLQQQGRENQLLK